MELGERGGRRLVDLGEEEERWCLEEKKPLEGVRMRKRWWWCVVCCGEERKVNRLLGLVVVALGNIIFGWWWAADFEMWTG